MNLLASLELSSLLKVTYKWARLTLTLTHTQWLKLGVTVVREGRGGVLVHYYFFEKNSHFRETWTPKKIVIFWRKLPLRLASDSKKKLQSFFELPIPIPILIPIPSKFSEKRMTHSPIPIPSGLTPVAGPIVETKNRAIFLERFFGRGITAREQLSRAVILARF